jgi:hypothetical protein
MAEHDFEFEYPVSVFLRGHTVLGEVVAKAAAHAREHKLDPAALLTARLFPDMFPLARQVQTACDTAKRAVARLASVEAPSFDDNERTFEALQVRIDKTADFIRAHAAGALSGALTRTIEFPMPPGTVTLPASQYLARFALPNFYFHLTTAYNILRHNGVVLGKMDYLGDLTSSLGERGPVH